MNQRFTLIQGDNAPLPGTRRRRRTDAVVLLCRVCKIDIGVPTSTWMKAKQGVMERAGKPEGGTDALLCVHCLARGKVTLAF